MGECVMKKRERESSICPRCLRNELPECPALSRRDNKTHICPQCGQEEAFIDFFDWVIEDDVLPSDWVEREKRIARKGDANEN